MVSGGFIDTFKELLVEQLYAHFLTHATPASNEHPAIKIERFGRPLKISTLLEYYATY